MPEATTPSIPHLTLIGDPLENFYQLGIKDRESHNEISNHLKRLIGSGFLPIDYLLQSGLKIAAAQVLKNNPDYTKYLKAYCEGLNTSLFKMAPLMLLPDLMSSIEKWIPGLNKSLFGCSSLFVPGDNQSIIHARILDYPLGGSFEKYERSLHFKLNNFPQIWSIGSSGIFLPTLTAMNERGVTIALHQKSNRYFNAEGRPIFLLMFDILAQCENKTQVLKLLKKSQSITSWCLNMSFSDGTILSVDITGNRLAKIETHISESQYHYFNNVPIENSLYHQDCQPFTHGSYCQMRQTIIKENLKHHSPKKWTETSVLEFLSTPRPHKNESAREWKMGPLTPTSVQVVAMNAKVGHLAMIPGESPKYWQGLVNFISQVWGTPEHKLVHKKYTESAVDYIRGMKEYAWALQNLDQKNRREAYHHLQMAIEYLKGYPEYWVARFYFHFLQYQDQSSKKDLETLLKHIQEDSQNLPPSLRDHALLALSRLEKLIIGNSLVPIEEIENENLRSLFEFESKLKPFVLKGIKKMAHPRGDSLDIIYTYFKK